MESNKRDLQIIEKIKQYCDEINIAHDHFGKSYEEFEHSSVYKNAVCLCLLQIGELVAKLSEDFKDLHPEIPWRAIKGMRNVVAHEYGKIDTQTVWETAENETEKLRIFCEQILSG